jgi:galactokinase
MTAASPPSLANSPGRATVELAQAAFEKRYGSPPRCIASAPGRVNLIGEYTDYNGGFVLPMAIDYRTAIAAAPNMTRRIAIYSEAVGEEAVIDLPHGLVPDLKGHWTNYIKGVLSGLLKTGIPVRGFNALIHSTVPVGGGLSSSAALELATAGLAQALVGSTLDPLRTVKLCQNAEHVFAGVPCGIMDQYIGMFARKGQALLLDCRSLGATWLPFDDPAVTVLIIDTRVKHDLAKGQYAIRRLACEEAARVMGVPTLREADLESLDRHAPSMSEAAMRCARHVVSEITRTERAASCIRDRDWSSFGGLLDASHESLKTDFNVSSPELDTVVDAAQTLRSQGGGVYGARMTGGGFGGCVVALIDTRERPAIEAYIAEVYRERHGIEARFFTSHAAGGVSVLEV